MARRRPPRPRPTRRYRRRGRYLLIGLVVLLVLSLAADRLGLFGYTGNDWRTVDQCVHVVAAVISGDQVELEPVNGSRRALPVRLIGVYAPLREEGQHWAEPSRDHLALLAEGREVVVRLVRPQSRDAQGHLLAYLYLNDHENLNLSMIRDGQAYADRRIDHPLRPQFELAENEARRRGRGLWAEVTQATMPPWRQQWLSEQRHRGSGAAAE